MARILIIMDSRGIGFEEILKQTLMAKHQHQMQVTVKVLAVSGANLQSIESKAIDELSKYRYDQVFVMLGINNITKRFYQKEVILEFENVPDLVDSLDNMYTSLKTKLQPYAPNIIICQLVGLDILMYNLEKMGPNDLLIADYPRMQQIVNEAMSFVNRSIDSMNISSNVIGPWIEDTIHANINGSKVHKYLRLYDGLHPDKPTKWIWAKKLAKAIIKNN